MNKRISEFHIQENLNKSLKKPKLNKDEISKFKLGDDWNLYRASLEDYFESEDINDDLIKTSTLISKIGKDAYQTMRDLCEPMLPNRKTYKELCEIMEKHYSEISVFKKRRHFHTLKQLSTDTISQWFSRVKEGAAQCNFGEQLDDRIKDQFVTGMEEGAILDCILKASYKMSLQNIVRIALRKEKEILMLPKEIMIDVFSYLSTIDWITIAKVDKLWQKVADQLWNDQKELTLRRDDLTLIEAILTKCGRDLEKISLEYNMYGNFNCALPIIAKYCPNIRSITLNAVSIKGLYILSENCRNISEISIHNFEIGDKFDEALGDFFANNNQLRIIDMPEFLMTKKGKCLSELPFEKIVTMKIHSVRVIDTNSQHKIIKVIKKLKNLSTFVYKTVDANVLEALSNSCRNLTELHLKLLYNYRTDDDVDSRLSQIFENNKKLKSLKLDNFDAMTGECFQSLAENVIEEITIIQARNIKRDYLNRSLPKFTKLHTLEFRNPNDIFYFYDVAECISLCSELKKLSIINFQIHEDLKLFASSKKIEWLTISLSRDQVVTKRFIDYMSSNVLELKYLDISGDYYNRLKCKFDSICKLQKLEYLNISYHISIAGSEFGNLPNLKELYCVGCENLEDENVISLLKCATNLRMLDIRLCKKISYRVIDTAIEVTRKRRNNIVLEIQIECSKIKPDETDPSTLRLPLLYIWENTVFKK